MLITLWSSKGGSGTTVTAAGLAVSMAMDGTDVTILDAEGDMPAVLGIAEPTGPRLGEFSGSDHYVEDLKDLRLPVIKNLGLVHRGSGYLDVVLGGGLEPLRDQLGGITGTDVWIADAGCVRSTLARQLVDEADKNYLVIRPCYLALRRATRAAIRPDGIILISEPARPLGPKEKDVENLIGAPIVATIDVDQAIAGAVDAGLLVSRVPPSLGRAARKVRLAAVK